MKIRSDIPLTGDIPPMAIQRATVRYDFTTGPHGEPVRVSLEGVLRVGNRVPTYIEAEVEDMTVTCPETGRRYKLVRTD